MSPSESSCWKNDGAARPLTALIPGTQVVVKSVEGGHNCSQRLAAMGILPGAELRIIKGGFGGPVIVEVIGSRFVLGRGMAHRVIVEVPPPDEKQEK